tara:strand:- start:34 stop:426 length:393 start_codon:yes stop_codon:yes gene_type:complete
MPGPLPAVGVILSFIAKKGAKEAVKKYGKKAVDNATKSKKTKSKKQKAYDVLRDGSEQAKRNYREKIREAKDSPYPYSKREKKEIRRYGATKAEMRGEYDTAKDEISQTVRDMGGFSKGGMVTKWEKKWG